MLALPFEVMTSEVEETSVQASSMQEYVKGVALLKTRDVAKKYPMQQSLVLIQLLSTMMSCYINQNLVRKLLLIYYVYQTVNTS